MKVPLRAWAICSSFTSESLAISSHVLNGVVMCNLGLKLSPGGPDARITSHNDAICGKRNSCFAAFSTSLLARSYVCPLRSSPHATRARSSFANGGTKGIESSSRTPKYFDVPARSADRLSPGPVMVKAREDLTVLAELTTPVRCRRARGKRLPRGAMARRKRRNHSSANRNRWTYP